MFLAGAPEDEAAARAVLAIAGTGAVSTETPRLSTEDEFWGIVGNLP